MSIVGPVKPSNENSPNETVVRDLSTFFDLLSQFDYKDQKKVSGSIPAPADSAPAGAGMGLEIQAKYGAENTNIS